MKTAFKYAAVITLSLCVAAVVLWKIARNPSYQFFGDLLYRVNTQEKEGTVSVLRNVIQKLKTDGYAFLTVNELRRKDISTSNGESLDRNSARKKFINGPSN